MYRATVVAGNAQTASSSPPSMLVRSESCYYGNSCLSSRQLTMTALCEFSEAPSSAAGGHGSPKLKSKRHFRKLSKSFVSRDDALFNGKKQHKGHGLNRGKKKSEINLKRLGRRKRSCSLQPAKRSSLNRSGSLMSNSERLITSAHLTVCRDGHHCETNEAEPVSQVELTGLLLEKIDRTQNFVNQIQLTRSLSSLPHAEAYNCHLQRDHMSESETVAVDCEEGHRKRSPQKAGRTLSSAVSYSPVHISSSELSVGKHSEDDRTPNIQGSSLNLKCSGASAQVSLKCECDKEKKLDQEKTHNPLAMITSDCTDLANPTPYDGASAEPRNEEGVAIAGGSTDSKEDEVSPANSIENKKTGAVGFLSFFDGKTLEKAKYVVQFATDYVRLYLTDHAAMYSPKSYFSDRIRWHYTPLEIAQNLTYIEQSLFKKGWRLYSNCIDLLLVTMDVIIKSMYKGFSKSEERTTALDKLSSRFDQVMSSYTS